MALQLSLPAVVRPHLLRQNLWEIMAKPTGEWKWSAPHLLWREHEHLKKGLLQSRCDRAWCMYMVRVLPSSLRGKILFVGKQPLPTGCNFSSKAILLSFLYWYTPIKKTHPCLPAGKVIHPLELVELLFWKCGLLLQQLLGLCSTIDKLKITLLVPATATFHLLDNLYLYLLCAVPVSCIVVI